MVKTSNLTYHETISAYQTVFLPSIRYPLRVIAFSSSQLHAIQQPVISAYLPKIGLNRHYPRAIVFAPTTLGGLGETLLTLDAGIQKLKLLLGHTRSKDDTGTMIIQEIEFLQLTSGYTTSILLHTTNQNFHIWTEKCWISSIMDFTHHHKISIHLPSLPLPQPQRIRDTAIMETIQHNKYSKIDLKTINACRIYLKVITVSDITSTNGLDIIPSMLNGHRNPSFHNTLKWPTQKKPSQEYWTLFKHCILDTYCKPNSYRLKRPLGAWTHQKIHYINWYTYIHPTTNLLIKFNPQHTTNK
jgi:hypothetical protein